MRMGLRHRRRTMKKNLLLLATLAAASTLATACARVESSTNILAPAPVTTTAPSPAPATPTPGSPYTGTWVSETFAVPAPGSCGNFQWHVTDATSTSMSGNFTATCAGNITVTASATGQLVGKTVPLTVTGTATYAGVVSCDFSL